MDKNKSNEFALERSDNVHGGRYETMQSVNDWCQLRPPAFLKSYLRHELYLHLKIRSRFLQRHSEDYIAVFTHLSGLEVREVGNVRDFDMATISSLVCPYRDVASNLGDSEANDEQPMFVKAIVFVNDGEDSVLRSWALVRLYRPDELLCGRTDALYTSLRTGFCEFINTGAYRELRSVRRHSVVLVNERMEQMVQARSEKIDDLSGLDGESKRNLGVSRHYECVLKSIVLGLSNKFVWWGIASSEEAGDVPIEILDVLYSPINLGPSAI